jgi:hypothetical protein
LKAEEISGFSGGAEVRRFADAAHAFVTVCRGRMLRIYREWYESVQVAELIAEKAGADAFGTKGAPPTNVTLSI